MEPIRDLESLRVLVSRSQRLGLLGQCYTEVTRLTAPGTSLREIEEFALRQPMFAGRVLRVANSALYAADARSVNHALAVLGLPQVRSILMSALVQTIDQDTPQSPIDHKRFLMRSLSLAVVSRRIASVLRMPDVESYYLAGLLQDVGYLAIAEFMPERFEKVTLAAKMLKDEDPLSISRNYLGFDHQEVGDLVAELWKFHEALRTAIRYHHEPISAPADFLLLADVAHVTSGIVDQVDEVAVLGIPPGHQDELAAKRLGFSDETVSEFRTQLWDHLPQLRVILDDILEEAA